MITVELTVETFDICLVNNKNMKPTTINLPKHPGLFHSP